MRAKWTGRIHREWMRAVLRKKPHLKEKIRRTRKLMDQNVLGCRVRGYERWEGRLYLPDVDDRHVLAAGLACVADLIVTNNGKDFPDYLLRPFGIRAVTPDQFLLSLWDSGVVMAAVREHRASMKMPAMSVEQYRHALAHNKLPGLANGLSKWNDV